MNCKHCFNFLQTIDWVCDCEHVDHFEGSAHDYAHICQTEPVKTPYGTFHLCKDCQDHHQIKAGIPYYSDAMMEDA